MPKIIAAFAMFVTPLFLYGTIGLEDNLRKNAIEVSHRKEFLDSLLLHILVSKAMHSLEGSHLDEYKWPSINSDTNLEYDFRIKIYEQRVQVASIEGHTEINGISDIQIQISRVIPLTGLEAKLVEELRGSRISLNRESMRIDYLHGATPFEKQWMPPQLNDTFCSLFPQYTLRHALENLAVQYFSTHNHEACEISFSSAIMECLSEKAWTFPKPRERQLGVVDVPAIQDDCKLTTKVVPKEFRIRADKYPYEVRAGDSLKVVTPEFRVAHPGGNRTVDVYLANEEGLVFPRRIRVNGGLQEVDIFLSRVKYSKRGTEATNSTNYSGINSRILRKSRRYIKRSIKKDSDDYQILSDYIEKKYIDYFSRLHILAALDDPNLIESIKSESARIGEHFGWQMEMLDLLSVYWLFQVWEKYDCLPKVAGLILSSCKKGNRDEVKGLLEYFSKRRIHFGLFSLLRNSHKHESSHVALDSKWAEIEFENAILNAKNFHLLEPYERAVQESELRLLCEYAENNVKLISGIRKCTSEEIEEMKHLHPFFEAVPSGGHRGTVINSSNSNKPYQGEPYFSTKKILWTFLLAIPICWWIFRVQFF